MSDLILKTQLEVLGRNLKRLQKFRDFLEQQRGEKISRLKSCLKGSEKSIQSSIDKISKRIHDIITNYERFLRDGGAKDEVKKLKEDEAFLRQEISRAKDHLDEAKDKVEMMQDPTLSHAEALTKIAGPAFAEKATELIGIINQIRELIEVKAPNAEQNNNKEDAENHRIEAWNKYSEKVHNQSHNLFTEYVDFMRGLAMRDAGLDEGICQIVDELVSKWKISNVSHSFSIPDRYEAVSMTLSRIIRIGFPEWTIWALPLAVHELGHIVVEVNETLKTFVEENTDEQNQHSLREILCDAFATYVMGPAYACAAILLRLNPLSKVFEESDHTDEAKHVHAIRVHAILDMLGWMSQLNDEKKYMKIIEVLKNEWKDAMIRAGQPANLKSTDQDQLDNWMIKSKGREKIKITTSGYTDESHDKADLLQRQFTSQGTNNEPIDYTTDLVIVLNAVWIARTYYPEKADGIEKAARSLWNKIAEGRKGGRQAPGDLRV